jgi:rhamnose transport system permease protein
VTALDYQSSSTATSASPLARLLRVREVPTILVLVLICLATSAVQHNFLGPGNIRGILMWMPLLIIVAMGEMMVIITRGVDVSVGSMMGLAGMSAGVLFRNHTIDNVYLGALLAIGIGGLLGAINGLLVTLGNVPPIVATLGTMGAFRGLVYVVSSENQINADQLPPQLDRWSIVGPFGQTLVPWLVIIALLVALVTFVFLRYTVTGRNIYAIGGNPDAARLRGVPVKPIIFLVYTITGLCSGLAGILYASRFGTLNAEQIGSGFELVVISAVVVGGVSIFGGAGTVLGVLLGSLLLATIYTALTVLPNVTEGWKATSYGFVILLAVIFDDVMSQRARE